MRQVLKRKTKGHDSGHKHQYEGELMNSNELQIVCRKENYGEVVYNDGQFAEIQLIGIEGIEEGLLEETIQIQREETLDSADDFRNRLKAGTCLQVLTTTLVSGVDGFSFRH